LPELENPLFDATSCLIYQPSFSQFCVKIPTFLLPWQQESSDVNFNDRAKLLDLENPRVVQHPRLYLLY